MKRSAIENQFKEKINAREIVPSKASWDRLDAMLTVVEKPKRNFRWMYVAASVLGFLLLGTLYFNQKIDQTVIENDTITVNESKVIPEPKAEPVKINLSKNIEQRKVVKKQLASTEIKSVTDSNKVLYNNKNQIVEKEVIIEEQTPIINQKAEQPIVLQKSKYVNVDELLASVDNASQKKSSTIAKSNVKVNSNELLSQVDGELDLTFREKAIKTVKQNFKTVKLALSNRNSE
ncbi:hypothetical protein [Flavobacterium sp. 5]|uniref:hypothetical protein n=1 Tax=Flavobacterium sp. 5 TaxID=2035199 RepID=UPI000C2C1E78|nr:hypothetical protein [Flavobacterium sp. 5]PKB16046.1 hypothetical protein CLU82_1161 [Flavobacterium sp. 5]